jgi:hypothetical protein
MNTMLSREERVLSVGIWGELMAEGMSAVVISTGIQHWPATPCITVG